MATKRKRNEGNGGAAVAIVDWTDLTDEEVLVVGTMTGTSLDGIDVSLIRATPGSWFASGRQDGVKVVGTFAMEFGWELKERMHGWCNASKALTAREVCELQRDFCELHVKAIEGLLDATKITREQLSLISVHGQTVFHAPPLSWQMISPSEIANKFNCDVMYDLRAADIAAGGQGAPITPLADRILFGSQERESGEDMVIVNLGGFCNITHLPSSVSDNKDCVSGRDVCAVNQMLDAFATLLFNEPYDKDGQLAAQYRQNHYYTTYIQDCQALLERHNASAQKGSLGTSHAEDYGAFLKAALNAFESQEDQEVDGDIRPDPEDRIESKNRHEMLAAACFAVAGQIWSAIREIWRKGQRLTVVLAGGGAKNKTLTNFLRELGAREDGETRVLTSEELCGLGVCDRESVAMAVLGAMSRCGKPITASSATGVGTPPVGGHLVPKPYPGR